MLAVALSGTAMAADATGTWTGTVKLPNGQELPFVAHLKQAGTAVTGKLDGINGAPDVVISNGKNQQDTVTFVGTRKINGADVVFNYTGRLTGETMDIEIVRADGYGSPLKTHTTREKE
jgi:opacity protein-like surface antigen